MGFEIFLCSIHCRYRIFCEMIYFIYRNAEDEPQLKLSTGRFNYVQRRQKCLKELQLGDLEFAEHLLCRTGFEVPWWYLVHPWDQRWVLSWSFSNNTSGEFRAGELAQWLRTTAQAHEPECASTEACPLTDIVDTTAAYNSSLRRQRWEVARASWLARLASSVSSRFDQKSLPQWGRQRNDWGGSLTATLGLSMCVHPCARSPTCDPTYMCAHIQIHTSLSPFVTL